MWEGRAVKFRAKPYLKIMTTMNEIHITRIKVRYLQFTFNVTVVSRR